jgi:hypothetical protein
MKTIHERYVKFCIATQGLVIHPSEKQQQLLLFGFGIIALTIGLAGESVAQLTTTVNDDRVANAVNALLTYVEGSFGALVMVAAGIGAIMSSAFGQYRAALSLLVVSVGAFILRSVLATFFNDTRIAA